MSVDEWLQMAVASARERALPDLAPLLETLAKATARLRAADAAQHPDPRVPDQA